MEFITTAENHCPPAIVERVASLDVTKFGAASSWWRVLETASSLECRSAMLGMMANKIDRSSEPNIKGEVMSFGARNAATNSPEVVQALTDMVHRLMPVTGSFRPFYKMLAANRIDMLEELPPIPIAQWEVPNSHFSHEAFLRAVYRLQMDAPLAQEHLAEGLALLSTNIDSLSSHVQFLLDTRPAQLPQLLEPYLDDPRRPRGIYGPGHPIGEYIKAKLKDPLGVPPRDVSNLKRQIFKTEGMR